MALLNRDAVINAAKVSKICHAWEKYSIDKIASI
jgi:hypothetical protein